MCVLCLFVLFCCLNDCVVVDVLWCFGVVLILLSVVLFCLMCLMCLLFVIVCVEPHCFYCCVFVVRLLVWILCVSFVLWAISLVWGRGCFFFLFWLALSLCVVVFVLMVCVCAVVLCVSVVCVFVFVSVLTLFVCVDGLCLRGCFVFLFCLCTVFFLAAYVYIVLLLVLSFCCF